MKKERKPSPPRPSGLGHIDSHEFGWVRRWVRGPCIGCGMVAFWWGGDSKNSQEIRYRATDGTVWRRSQVPPCPNPVPKLKPGQRRGAVESGSVDSEPQGTFVAGISEGAAGAPC